MTWSAIMLTILALVAVIVLAGAAFGVWVVCELARAAPTDDRYRDE